MAYEETSGRQFRFGMPGAVLSEAEWKNCLKTVSDLYPYPEYVVASGSLPPGVPADFYARLAVLVKERGGKLVVDTKGEPLRTAVGEGVYLIKPNIDELTDIVGRRPESDRDIERSVRELIGTGGSSIVIVSLGSGGVFLVTEEISRRINAPTVPVISKIGAGDSLTAGVVMKLSQGEDLLSAVLYGIAAGSAAVMTPGSELCRKADTDRLYAGMTEKE